ncbi:metallophosphoesterase [Catellatospora coxensis]|uniref:Calcineurin-like phosphoesterase family protein n=1 Tax=Catellatospora coxensis TaxID=310354 RepID=A0A8J3PA78_9ACTN|nr:metallophosphoesterase [Catellatospora coxensis]GIG10006.1 hypothetical protein Cco03nite_67060 [Catellatospora coxensis]
MTVIPPRSPSDPTPVSGRTHRPSKLEPAELGFTPQPPVAWLSPLQLAATGVRVAFAAQFGAYLDKRELQNAFPTKVHDEHMNDDELWMDYVADLGDGFNATYSVAYLMAQEEIEASGERLPRGRVLVLGGDSVYPTASGKAYEDRFEGPFRAALPQVPAENGPTLFALPGNHDWYDGLTAFLRLFARREGSRIGGWRTKQTRSYFALQLPHRWWLLALDAQGAAYMDDPQLEYFRGVAANIEEGDRIILVTPQPAWVQSEEHPLYYDTIDYFLRTVIDPTGASVALMVSGDLHHYARYAQSDSGQQLITCGGGGAYMAATNHLPEAITVPPKHSQVRRQSTGLPYKLQKTYPTKLRSRWLGSGVFARLPWRNPGFATMLGIMHTMLMLALNNAAGRILTVPIFMMTALVMFSCVFFSVGLTEAAAKITPVVLGALHGCAHIALGVLGLSLWRLLPFDGYKPAVQAALAVLIYLTPAGVAAALLVSLYLLIAASFKVNVNELYAGQGIEDFKSFLRMRFAPDGTLSIYVVGIDKISKKWVPQAAGSWFRPATALKPRLVDEVITLGPAKQHAAPPAVLPSDAEDPSHTA